MPLRQARSVWMQLEAWRRATVAQRQTLADAVTASRREASNRRQRVLAHPDIAARLVRLGCSTPDRWTGYVPPRVAYWQEDGTGVPNDSAVRRGLIDILNAVAERESAGAS